MSDFGDGKMLKTSKYHRCEWCYEGIKSGVKCYHYKGMYDSEWQDWYMHPECFEDYKMDGENEFTPGSAERPVKITVSDDPAKASFAAACDGCSICSRV